MREMQRGIIFLTLRHSAISMFEILRGTLKSIWCCLYKHFIEHERESDEVSTWAKLDVFTYKHCSFMCISTVKDFLFLYVKYIVCKRLNSYCTLGHQSLGLCEISDVLCIYTS